jgi:acetolactate synthase-1/2/3 large subunit
MRRGEIADGPVTTWQFYRALGEVIDDDTFVVSEGVEVVMCQRYIARTPVVTSGEIRAIGHGMGTALGLKCAFPEKQVVLVAGDGSCMMELQELATAVRADLPIVIAVLRNEAYGGMKQAQIEKFGGRVIGTDLYLPDLPQLAASFGIDAARVETSASLAPALRAALSTGRTTLLDVPCPITPRRRP